MAGDAVVWTPEMKARASRKMRATRRSESKAKRSRRTSRFKHTMIANPDIELRRAQQISRTRLGKSDELSKIASVAYKRKSAKAKAATLANLRLAHTSISGKKRVATRASYQHRINRKIAAGVKTDWDNTSISKKRERVIKALSAGAKPYSLINGSVERFHSSWEAACADVLISIGRKYKTQRVFNLGGYSYHADFILYGKIIIEVKGAPKAWERWNRKTLPAIKRHLDPSWNVFVLNFKPALDDYSNFDDFLSEMRKVQ